MVDFVVEDGTGLADSTSYVDIAFADDYLGATWATDDPTKQEHLIKATEYVDIRWGSKFKSRPLQEAQALEFPRNALYRYGKQIEGIPTNLKKAVCLYSQLSLSGNLYPEEITDNLGPLKRTKKIVGPVTKELEYYNLEGKRSDFLPHKKPDMLIRPYIQAFSCLIRC